jgi:hypothetical protein
MKKKSKIKNNNIQEKIQLIFLMARRARTVLKENNNFPVMPMFYFIFKEKHLKSIFI